MLCVEADEQRADSIAKATLSMSALICGVLNSSLATFPTDNAINAPKVHDKLM